MLRQASAVVLSLLATSLFAPTASADGNTVNQQNQSPAASDTIVSHVCQQDPSSAFCRYKMTVTRTGQDAAPKKQPPPPPPSPPPPTCSYQSMFQYTAPEGIRQDGSVGPQEYDVQSETCPPGATNVDLPLKFMPLTPTSPAASAKALADQIYATLHMPAPPITMAPAADATQYVGMPLWAWLPASSWTPKTTSAAADGVTLKMTATPVVADWSMGDGGSMTCTGPGTPYPMARPRDDLPHSPDCGYTYTVPSSSQPNGRFPVSATTHWKVTWSTSSGLSGAEPDLTATATTRVKVSEIQALVTEVHP